MYIENLTLPSDFDFLNLYGKNDCNLRFIQDQFKVKIIARGNKIIIQGEKEKVINVFFLLKKLSLLVEKKEIISFEDICYFSKNITIPNDERIPIFTTFQNCQIKPKTSGQEKYVKAIKDNDLIFCIGPAGTGKTYLAVAIAVSFLKEKKVDRIILVRPAIEVGESLGYLPGNILEKVDPYFRPLYDALYDMLGMNEVANFISKGTIEIAPLAYMRGRTLNNAFIILDEAQNTTCDQMKMFLTRIGFFSKIIVTGDVTQIDLAVNKKSGLVEVQQILQKIKGIKFIPLSKNDVVRHRLVKNIIKAYEQLNKNIIIL
ncbi:MAG: PhoH family protein [bacterium]